MNPYQVNACRLHQASELVSEVMEDQRLALAEQQRDRLRDAMAAIIWTAGNFVCPACGQSKICRGGEQ